MTFDLKDFESLKKHFNETITMLLAREGRSKIEELTQRKEEVLFLKAILTELDNRISRQGTKNLKPYAEIFYGAQALIQKDIEASQGYIQSLGFLHERLNDGMGINTA